VSEAVRHRALLRIVIAAVAAIDLLSLAHFIQLARAGASPAAFAGCFRKRRSQSQLPPWERLRRSPSLAGPVASLPGQRLSSAWRC
jgi:hypothetical protein